MNGDRKEILLDQIIAEDRQIADATSRAEHVDHMDAASRSSHVQATSRSSHVQATSMVNHDDYEEHDVDAPVLPVRPETSLSEASETMGEVISETMPQPDSDFATLAAATLAKTEAANLDAQNNTTANSKENLQEGAASVWPPASSNLRGQPSSLSSSDGLDSQASPVSQNVQSAPASENSQAEPLDPTSQSVSKHTSVSSSGQPPLPPLPPLPPEGSGLGNSAEEPEPRSMSLLEHLGELRIRLTRMLIGIILGFLLCYGVAEILFYYLSLPLVKVMPADTKLIFTGIPEGFFVYLKVAFVAGVFVSSPYMFYQIWAFIAPGLYDEEKKYMIPLAACSALFFLAGASFCYFVVFPFAFTFFMSYSTDTIIAMPSLNEYLDFSLKMLLAFGLIFEMPLFTFFLARMGLVSATMMRKYRKYAILCVFIVAAILTPPDVFSQVLMAIPMLLLYELSIFVAQTVQSKPKQVAPDSAESASANSSSSSNSTNSSSSSNSTNSIGDEA